MVRAGGGGVKRKRATAWGTALAQPSGDAACWASIRLWASHRTMGQPPWRCRTYTVARKHVTASFFVQPARAAPSIAHTGHAPVNVTCCVPSVNGERTPP
eukprot:1649461-Prymnesium_polylepis.1